MRRRPILLAGGLLVLALLAWAAWTAWTAVQVNRDLTAAVADAGRLQAAVESDDDAGADAALADLRDHSQAAADRTGGVSWSAATWLPVVGDDASGVRVVSEVVADLSRDGIEPLLRTSRNLDALVPQDGRISIEAVTDLRDAVAEGSAAFDAAERRLQGEDPASYVDRFREKYVELSDRVTEARDVLGSADTALQVLPGMLGAEGPRDYLLVFQNNAEIRATGGLPGAVSLVHAEDGRVELVRQVAPRTFGESPEPVLPLGEAEEEIYYPQLGTYFIDANFTPDWPRASELMAAHWQRVEGDEVDGVLAVDPVALSYVLGATGPVEAAGRTLTQDNVVDELLHRPYLEIEDPVAQDEYFQAVAAALFARVTGGGGSGEALVRALAKGASEGRVLVSSTDEDEQAVLSGTRVAGEVVTQAGAEPEVGVYLNDATGAKMSYFLRYDAQVEATSCDDGVQVLDGLLHLESVAPPDAATLPDYVTGGGAFGIPEGSELLLIRFYGPVDGTVSDVRLGKRKLDPEVVVLDGRPVVTVNGYLTPGASLDFTWSMTTGADQDGDVQVSVTPSVEPGNASSVAPSSC